MKRQNQLHKTKNWRDPPDFNDNDDNNNNNMKESGSVIQHEREH